MNTPATPANSSGRSRLQFLDTMRGVAILGVFIYHSIWEVSGHPMRWSSGFWDPDGFEMPRALLQFALQCCSVPSMFFLISGYLIHRHFCNGREVNIQYVIRRNLRLYLPFLVVLALFLLAYQAPVAPPYAGADGRHVLQHLLLVFAYFGSESAISINPSFWFVAVEVQLCFAYLVFRPAFQRFGWMSLMSLLLVIELAARYSNTVGADWLYATPLAYPFTWMLGAWLAQLQAQGRLPAGSGHKAAAWALVTVAATAVQALEFFASMGLALAAFYFISWLLQRKTEPVERGGVAGYVRSRTLRFVRLVGAMSLWAYLLNQPILFYIETALRPLVQDPLSRILVSAFTGWLVVLPLAWIMLRHVEPQLVRLINAVSGVPARPVVSQT